MDGLTLPDPDDCHVLAAALTAGAETILTMNLRDFPPSCLSPHGIAAVHPDDFLSRLHDTDPDLVRASTEAAQTNLSRSTPSFEDYLGALKDAGLPQLTQRLRLDERSSQGRPSV